MPSDGTFKSPYAQISLTYIHRFGSSRIATFGAITDVGLLVVAGSTLMAIGRDPSILLLASFLTFVPVVGHVKEQFARWDSRLVPGYRRAHLMVAATVATFLAVLVPAAAVWLSGLRSAGLVAMTVFLLGAILLCELKFTGLSWLLFPWFLVAAVSSHLAGPVVMAFVSGQFEPQAIALLVLGAVMVLLGGWRLVRLEEQMPRLGWWSRLGSEKSHPRTQRSSEEEVLHGSFGHLLNERASPKLDKAVAAAARHALSSPTSGWSRIRRWEVRSPFHIAGWCGFALVTFATLLGMQGVVWYLGARPMTTFVVPTTFFIFLLPASMSMGFLSERTKVMAVEVLLPVDRAAYLRQIGTLAAVVHFQLWSAMGVAAGVFWCAAGGQSFSLANLVGLLIASGLAQLGFFGLIACFLPNRSNLLVLVAVAAFVSAMIMPMLQGESIIGGKGTAVMPIILSLAAVFGAVGLVLTYVAYRRWLAMDFD